MKTYRCLLIAGIVTVSGTTLFAQENLGANTAVNAAVNSGTSLATNVAPSEATNAPAALEVPELGQPLLSQELKERLKITPAQQVDLQPIEDDFVRTRLEYQAANRARIEAAYEADRQARIAKDEGQIKTAAEQLQRAWSGLRPERKSAMTKVKQLLSPEQLKKLEAQKDLAEKQ